MNNESSLSYQLLSKTAIDLESSFSNDGRFNFPLAKYAGDASLILEYSDLTDRFNDLMGKLTPEKYWKNSKNHSKEVPKYYKKISSLSDIRENHPKFPNNIHEYLDPYILGINEEHLMLCIQGNYDKAYEIADSDLGREEVLLTQVVFGDIENALRKRDLLTWESRRNGVLFVAAIELFRHGHKKLGKEIYDLIKFNDWKMAMMALGIENYTPWKVYPYPDY